MSVTHLIREKVIPVGWLLLAPFIMVSVILWAPTVKGDPADQVATLICSALDQDPTVGRIESMVTAFVARGVDPYVAGAGIGEAIYGYCPWHSDIAAAFVHKWSGQPGVLA